MKLISSKEVLKWLEKLKTQHQSQEDNADWVIGYLDAINQIKADVDKISVRAKLYKN